MGGGRCGRSLPVMDIRHKELSIRRGASRWFAAQEVDFARKAALRHESYRPSQYYPSS